MTIWDAQHETIDRERLEELQLDACGGMLARVHERVPFYRARWTTPASSPATSRASTTSPACRSPRRPTSATTTRSACSPCRTSEVVEIHSSSGTTGKPVVCGLHQGRPRDLGRARVPARGGRRGARERRRPDRVRLRHVHRRLRPALRAAARRRHRDPRQRRQHRPPAPVHARLRHDRARRHAVLRALPRRGGRRSAVCRWTSSRLRLGLFGAEACSEEMRAQIESRLPIRRHRQLRAHRDHRPGRRRRVRVPRRHARRRGPLHRRVPRPGDRRAGGRRRGRRARLHARSRASARRCCATAPATSPRSRTSPAPAGAPWRAWARSSAAPTTCSSSAASTSSRRRSRACCSRSRASSPSTRSCSSAERSSTRSRCRSRSRRPLFDGWMDDLRAFERRVTEELRSALLVRPKVKLVEPGTLQRSEGKARRVIDNRPPEAGRSRGGWACAYVKRPAVRAPASRRRPESRSPGKVLSQSTSGLLVTSSAGAGGRA